MRIRLAAVRMAARQFGPGLSYEGGTQSFRERFHDHFGMRDTEVRAIWNLIDETVKELEASHVVWLLAALAFLRTYPTTSHLACTLNRTPKTVRKYVWIFTEHLARLEVVCYCREMTMCRYWQRHGSLTRRQHAILSLCSQYRQRLDHLHQHTVDVHAAVIDDENSSDTDFE